MKKGDLVKVKMCTWESCYCMFCSKAAPRLGIVIQVWRDEDDQDSAICLFGEEEACFRPNSEIEWMSTDSIEVV